MENVDFGELMTVFGALGVAVIGVGAVISRYTKTEADDKFFAKLAKALGLKSLDG